MKISVRLILSFSAVLFLTVLLSVIGINRVNLIDRDLTQINDVNSVKQRYAINFRGSVHDRAISLRDVALVSDPAELQAALNDITRLAAFYAESARALDRMFAEATDISPQERAILAGIKETEAKTLPLIDTVIERRRAGDTEGMMKVLMQDARPLFTEWLARINGFIDLQEGKNQEVATSARATAAGFETFMIVLTGVALLIGAIVAWWNIHAVMPLRALTANMLKLARGDLSVEVPSYDSKDEVGDIVGAVRLFKDSMVEIDRLRASQESERAESERQKMSALEAMASRVETESRKAVDHVSERTQAMDRHALSMSSSAEQMSLNSQSVADSARQALGNAEAVATAAGQMASSIREISSQVSHGSTVGQRAVEKSDHTEKTIGTLSEAVNRIGEVATLISDIAEQTNLLALNATIEAARAGDAGKGFAVVASEVKNLAGQTAKATEEIASQIGNIQSVTKISVDAVQEISRTIGEMSSITGTIATAIEEQSAATQEISNNIQQTADAVREVSKRIVDVSDEAARTGKNASTVRDTSTEVATAISDLRELLVRVVRSSMEEVGRQDANRRAGGTNRS